AREAELREAARIAARADELQALRELGTLEQAEPREGDEAVRDELTRRVGGYVQSDVDAWLAHALAAHLGHYRDPAAREAAAGLPSPLVLAHAALPPNSPAWSPMLTSTSGRSRPGLSPPSPKPLVPSLCSSPAPVRSAAFARPAPTPADLTLRNPSDLPAPWEATCEGLGDWGQKCPDHL
ncbi:hypothetical protein ACFWNT_48025, partial [Streptomyces sp. NPDC058409]